MIRKNSKDYEMKLYLETCEKNGITLVSKDGKGQSIFDDMRGLVIHSPHTIKRRVSSSRRESKSVNIASHYAKTQKAGKARVITRQGK